MFAPGRTPTTTIAAIDYARDAASSQLLESLSGIATLEIEERQDEERARKELSDGDIGYLLIIPEGLAATMLDNPPATVTLVYDDSTPFSEVVVSVVERFVDRANLEIMRAPSRLALSKEGIRTRNLSYFDYLLPGIAIWGVMNFSVIGLASTMSMYREKKILKRILSTPLRVRDFFAAQILAYLVVALAQAAIILTAGALIFDVAIEGNIVYIALLVLIGNIVFLNMGFIVGAASKSVAAASGIGNAVVLPLMFFSGVFFYTDSLPRFLEVLIDYLPLSPLLEAVRGVALEAEPFWDFPVELAVVAFWIVATSVVAVRVFRFR